MFREPRKMKPIPISAAKIIADEHGYDQVIVVARRVGEAHEPHGEHCTTYGINKANCAVAARIGDFFKFNLMGWPSGLREPIAEAQVRR
jgi:hypothetical protein